MATSKSHRFSPGALGQSFAAIAFPVHVWAIINILIMVPAWMLRASLGELAGAVGYPLVDALLESAVLWLIFVLLGVVLPKAWLADRFVACSSALGWLLAAWAILIQFIFNSLLQWSSLTLISGCVLIGVTLGGLYWALRHFAKLAEGVQKAAQSLTVLTYLYLAFDLLGLVAVILRNL